MGKKGKVRVKQKGGAGAANVNPLADLMQPPAEDMIMPPQRGDPNVSIPWPSMFRNMDSSNFIVIYPTYLDSTKTVKVGRRISKVECVEEPSILDLSDACRTLNYRHVVEPWKGFPSDPESRWNNPGRVKVDLMSAKGVSNKMGLIKEIAATIVDMPTRIQRVQEKITKQKQKEEKEIEEAKARESAANASSSSTSNKKKGKGKKRR